MKVFIVPDIHLKPWMIEKAEELIDDTLCEKIIFLGDIADDWGQQENPALYKETYDKVVSFMKFHQNTMFCYGNHDIAYVWGTTQTGYSHNPEVREVVINGLQAIKATLPDGACAFIHKIGDTLFSHGGLTESFVIDLWPSNTPVYTMINDINQWGKPLLWRDNSPIWARPQSIFNGNRPYRPDKFWQVVGHSPVIAPYEENGVLTLDTFSTGYDGIPIGDQRFVFIDTEAHTWEYCDNKKISDKN